MLTVKHNLREFNATLKKYIAVSKLDWQKAVTKKGRDLSFRLAGYSGRGGVRSGGFGPPVQASPEKIEQEARARNWRVRRRPDGFTAVGPSGVSSFAEQALNRRFANPSKYARSVRGILKLNRRAALVALELGLRKRAAAGGTLASCFLTRRFPRKPGQAGERRNNQGRKLAEAILGNQTLTLKAFHPAVRKYEHVIVKALQKARDDMLTYIRRKTLENWEKLGKKLGKGALA